MCKRNRTGDKLHWCLPTTGLMHLIWKSTWPGTEPLADRHRAADRYLPTTAKYAHINKSRIYHALTVSKLVFFVRRILKV